MWFFLVLIAWAYGHGDNPHEYTHPLSTVSLDHTVIPPSGVQLEPKLVVSPSTVRGNWSLVNVQWENISYPGKTDYIGVFTNVEELPYEDWGSPINFRIICDELDCESAPSNGNLTFHLINRREPYRFVYFGGTSPYIEWKAVSNKVQFLVETIPMHVHTAVGDAINATHVQLYIMWVQKLYGVPFVQYGFAENEMNRIGNMEYLKEVKREDMCDVEEGEPAGNGGFANLGFQATVILEVPYDSKIFYHAGDNSFGFTDVYSFLTPKSPGSPTTLVAFGDMGSAPKDGSKEHSFDNHNSGQLGALHTIQGMTDLLNANEDAYDFVLHFGDISYATGYLSEWDEFMFEIAPIASRKPYMCGIGNHEFGYSGSQDQSSDSGGECGVPYNFYFPYAAQGLKTSFHKKKPWYAFEFGNVHVVQFSTEHNFTMGSEQYKWLEQDLASVDREVTPWIIVTGHRPLYIDSEYYGDGAFAQDLRDNLETLMLRYKVNLGFYGHYHGYQRSCPVIDNKCQDDGKAPIHLVLGMAGYSLTHNTPNQAADWALYRDQINFGYAVVDLPNKYTGSLQFVNSSTKAEVIDRVTFNNYAI